MQRLTVSVDEALIELARADVAAGRAESISAWVADAMRTKAQARAELIADLEELERTEPTPREVLSDIARALGKPESWVKEALGLRKARRKR